MRKGITPVIAVILLLMITVAIVGGVYLWINAISKDKMGGTDDILNTEVSIEDLVCDSGDTINISLENGGKRTINAGTTFIYVRDATTDSLKGRITIDWSGQDFENPNGFSQISNIDISSAVDWDSGDIYNIEIEFPAHDYKVDKDCTVD